MFHSEPRVVTTCAIPEWGRWAQTPGLFAYLSDLSLDIKCSANLRSRDCPPPTLQHYYGARAESWVDAWYTTAPLPPP
ncbi:hypothetical protein PAN31117_04647 [Pandoraea anapnoica]|uniref:Uncharacterized protein n=1 Tax=Pandoraea anapnoica TaxID=2508301 RepID=A0A5E5AI53_9BURK|nr:hypothetical protein PAN31117_04647 [Pandoraea anapnoica]